MIRVINWSKGRLGLVELRRPEPQQCRRPHPEGQSFRLPRGPSWKPNPANRFLPPVEAKPWPGVRNCLTYGPACPSGIGISENGDNSARGVEDTFLLYRTGEWLRGENRLRLNVWTPGPNTSGKKRAVMVFMHGGGYTGGSSNLLSYDGQNMVCRHDDRFADSGNVGMLVNLAVLEWVRDNIANFGGDPVT